MGYITIIFLSLTIAALLFGFLRGLVRGVNRSILSLIIIIGSIIAAFFLRKIVADFIFGLQINGQSIKGHILALFTSGEMSIPVSMQNLLVALVDIVAGIVSYLLLFYLIRLVSWITIFPICKIFVQPNLNKHAWWGSLVGFIQGVVIAFCVLAPATGLIVQVDELSKLKLNGAPLFKISEEWGLTEYHESTLGQTYIKIGDWYFNLMASTETEDGTVVNIHDSVDIVSTAIHFMESVTDLSNGFDVLDNPQSTSHQKASALTQIGDKLIEIGDNIDSLSDQGKELLGTIVEDVIDLFPTEDLPEEISAILENIVLEDANLVGVGESVKGISDFIDKVEIENTPDAVTQEDINNIIHGLSLNPSITDSLASLGGGLLDVEEMGFEQEFMDAIGNIEDAEVVADLLTLFGLN